MIRHIPRDTAYSRGYIVLYGTWRTSWNMNCKELFKDFYFNLFDKSLALVYLILWYAIVKLEVYLSQQVH